MAPSAELAAPSASSPGKKMLDRLVADLKDELTHSGKRAANLRLLRALAVFAAGVVVARNFGEALFVA